MPRAETRAARKRMGTIGLLAALESTEPVKAAARASNFNRNHQKVAKARQRKRTRYVWANHRITRGDA